MDPKVIITNDGSSTVSIPEMNVTYHSVYGAIQESRHVFIQEGLLDSGIFDYKRVHQVLEIGLGTGLNALLTLLEADVHKNCIYYTAIEPYPLEERIVGQLNYCTKLHQLHYLPHFEKIHYSEWGEATDLSEFFRLTKQKCRLTDFFTEDLFDVIYFDAFAPNAQPELWTRDVFEKMFYLLKPGGILVTYCSKGEVRRNMMEAGFKVEKIPGPPGKREMLRVRKPFVL